MEHFCFYSFLYWDFCCCYCYVTSVVSDSVQPQRRQPTRLPRPWDSPGKNTEVDCHFPLQCMKVRSESEVAQLCQTPSDPMDCCLPGSSTHGICQARVLEWGAIAFSGNYTAAAAKSLQFSGWAVLLRNFTFPLFDFSNYLSTSSQHGS